MTDRILDLSETPAYLRVRYEQLVVEREAAEPVTVPISEIAAIILAHPQVRCSQPVLAAVMEHGGAVIACNDRYLPVGLMLPTTGHSTQAERFAAQAAASRPTRKRLWRGIVRAKIRAQAALLAALRGDDRGLAEMVPLVRSGDPDNVEAQAARRYWPALFDDPLFIRRFDGDDQNRFLNYGYAVLRAAVGRAICAAGLHPSLGLHHHNRYDAFCLADDLMEPYRPVVDAVVVEHVAAYGRDAPLNRAGKQAILAAVLGLYRSGGEARTLFDWVARTATSLVRAFQGGEPRLFFPRGLARAGD